MLATLLISGAALAQNRTITGRITDDKGTPLSNVSVQVKGLKVGTVTDREGNFSVSVPDEGRILVFSYSGMTTEEEVIGNQTNIMVSMKPANINLQEVVVVGYGTQRRKDVTASITRIDGGIIQDLPVQGPDQALRGRAPGVIVTQSSGTPGSSINVNIRGAGSISASNQPLYVIDGVPINIGSYSQIGVGGQTLNSLADINPNEIESFEILKDAAATAIYGSRAANGVVIITTKRGRNARTTVAINSYYGLQKVYKKLEPLTGPEHVALIQEAVRNRFGPTIVPSQIGLAGLDANPATYPTTNWQNEIFRTAPVRSHDISLRGGNEKTRFFFSTALFDQK